MASRGSAVFLCVVLALLVHQLPVRAAAATFETEWPRTLYDAAERGDAAEVQALLERNAESWLWLKMFSSAVNTQFSVETNLNGWSALHTAAFHGHRHVVEVLLAWKTTDVNLRDSNGGTPLLAASRAGHVEVVKALLKDGRVDVNVPNNLGATPLWEAAHRSHLHVLEWIVASGCEVDVEHEGRPHLIGWRATSPLATATDVAQSWSWTWRSWLGQDAARRRAADVVWLLERFAGDSVGTRHEVRALLPANEVALLDMATRRWEATERGKAEAARLKPLRAKREAKDGPAVQQKRRDREAQAKLAETGGSAQAAILKQLQGLVSWPSVGAFVGTVGVTVAAAVFRAVCRTLVTGLYQFVRQLYRRRRTVPRRANPPAQRPRGGASVNAALLQVETQDGPCVICTEDDAVLVCVNTTCRHRFCLGCVDAHLKARQDERASYSCLAVSCPEVIAANVVEVVGSKHTVDRHHRFAAETGSSSAPSAAVPIDAASLAVIAKIAKTCPGANCGAYIQKNEGCDHMTCRVCKHEFCWQCLGDWRTRAHTPTCAHRT